MPRKKEIVSGTFIKYDAVVLGSGPAGEGAAMKLAKSGKRVAIVDMREQLGGNCTHVGTIPSKALRQTVSSIIRYQRDPMFQKVGEWKQFTMKQVLRNAHKVIQVCKWIRIHAFMTAIKLISIMAGHIFKIRTPF